MKAALNTAAARFAICEVDRPMTRAVFVTVMLS